jgi:hypothetical protein
MIQEAMERKAREKAREQFLKERATRQLAAEAKEKDEKLKKDRLKWFWQWVEIADGAQMYYGFADSCAWWISLIADAVAQRWSGIIINMWQMLRLDNPESKFAEDASW